MGKVILKDGASILDYTIDWSDWLATGETISASTWTVPTGLTSTDTGVTTTSATVWLSGGTRDTVYVVTNEIDTNQSRTAQRSLVIRVEER